MVEVTQARAPSYSDGRHPTALRLEKYHGLGNDFLVLVDLADELDVGPSAARLLCDRRRGIGADGIIRVFSGAASGADYTMVLRNADGTRAEMSGNGIRCLARALVDLGVEKSDRFIIATGAGPRRVVMESDSTVTVAMGMARVFEVSGSSQWPTMGIDMGNPHAVIRVDDVSTVDLDSVAAHWGGTLNVEVVALGPRLKNSEPTVGPGGGPMPLAVDHVVTMRVHERGVGETMACGTGAAAAAFAFRQWGLVGEWVTVEQPGGRVEVDLSGPEVLLRGPALRVATVCVSEPPRPQPMDGWPWR